MKKSALSSEEKLFLSLAQSTQLLRRVAERSLTRFGLTLAEYQLLRVIDRTPRVPAKEIQRRLNISAPAVAQLTAELEDRALLVRKQTKKDARVRLIWLTPHGQKTVTAARRAMGSESKRLLGSNHVVDKLSSALQNMISHLSHSLS